MRFTTDENEDCRDIAVRVREIGECQPIYEDDDNFYEFLEVSRAINSARRELPKEVQSAYSRAWQKKHPERVKQTKALYHAKNRDALRAYYHTYYIEHIEQRKEYGRKYYQTYRLKRKVDAE
jgi:hypothetical protein